MLFPGVNKFYGSFLWIGFTCPKAVHPLNGDSNRILATNDKK